MSICLPAGLRCLVTEEERREKTASGRGGQSNGGALVTRSLTIVLTQRDITVQLSSELSLCERNDGFGHIGIFLATFIENSRTFSFFGSFQF